MYFHCVLQLTNKHFLNPRLLGATRHGENIFGFPAETLKHALLLELTTARNRPRHPFFLLPGGLLPYLQPKLAGFWTFPIKAQSLWEKDHE